MKQLAPIALFIYNRPEHTLKTLHALFKNKLIAESVLYIFCDGPKVDACEEMIASIKECREVARSRQWAQEVIIQEQPLNIGLAASIINGVSKVVAAHGRVIVIEDDIVTTEGFLQYMNDALDIYEPEERAMHISGYFYPVENDTELPETFFFRLSSCWGWATWERAWNKLQTDPLVLKNKLVKHPHGITKFNIDSTHKFTEQLDLNINGRMKTWAIKWYASIFLNDGLCLHPRRSLVQNIGFDNSGTHAGSHLYLVPVLASKVNVVKQEVKESGVALDAMKVFYKKYRGQLPERTLKSIKLLLIKLNVHKLRRFILTEYQALRH